MVDLLNQESLVANNELDLVNRENEVDLARLSLIRILQIDPLGEYEFVIPEIAQGSAVPINYDLGELVGAALENRAEDRKSTRLNSSHVAISYAVFCLKKKTNNRHL